VNRPANPPNGWGNVLAVLLILCLLVAGLYYLAGCVTVPKAKVASPAVIDAETEMGDQTAASESGPAQSGWLNFNWQSGGGQAATGFGSFVAGLGGVIWFMRRQAHKDNCRKEIERRDRDWETAV